MEIKIKNMVCPRCIKVVKDELEKVDIEIIHLELGKAEIETKSITLSEVAQILSENGFELLKEKEEKLVEEIRIIIIELIRGIHEVRKMTLSDLLSKKLGKDYALLSNLFSSTSGTTIEKFYINQKIEYAKELLIYGEMNNTQISNELDYSSLAHFSNQFKSFTGFTPSNFKKQIKHKRKFIDSI